MAGKPKYNPWDLSGDPDMAKLSEMQSKAVSDQQNLMDMQRMNLGSATKFNPMSNLAPLIGLTDQWTGSQLGKAYSAPESGQQRLAKIQALESGLAAAQNTLTDNQMNQLKEKLQEKKSTATLLHQDQMQERGFAQQTKLKQMEIDAANAKLGNKEPIKDQYQAAGFAKRAKADHAIIAGLEKGGYDPSTPENAFQRGDYTFGVFPEHFKDENTKSYQQAKLDFVTAVLRQESGAAIGKEEYEKEEQKYFPKDNDTPAIKAQKAAARERAIASLEAEGASAMGRISDIPVSQPVNRTPGTGNKNPWDMDW